MIAIFPPPFSAVNIGSSSYSVCEAEEAEDADAEIIDIGSVRMLSTISTPAVPTYFHFTISSDATRITEAMFSNVAVY